MYIHVDTPQKERKIKHERLFTTLRFCIFHFIELAKTTTQCHTKIVMLDWIILSPSKPERIMQMYRAP